MKKIITTYFLLAALGLQAQDNADIVLSPHNSHAIMDSSAAQNTITPSNDKRFEEAAEKNEIPYRYFDNIKDTENGFYIITGVFNEGSSLKKALKKLKKSGFDANTVYDEENTLHYVYCQKYDNGLDAVQACVVGFDDIEKNELWILNVRNEAATETQALVNNKVDSLNSFEENNNQIEPAEQTRTVSARNEKNTDKKLSHKKNNTHPSGASVRLIDEANSYFDRMWYAEAAEVYEKILAKGEKNYTFDVIQKAADSYYYNTNMIKAYEWYDVLYNKYGKEMSTDNVFKYAHALKGKGKYGKSKKIMRLYKKKMESEEIENIDDIEPLQTEAILDEILKTNSDIGIKNLAINSKFSDFAPVLLDSTQLVFASAQDSSQFLNKKYKWNDQPYLDLFVAKINAESKEVKDAVKFSKQINTKYHEASVAFSPDNETMFFTRNNYGKKLRRDNNGVNHLKIYRSTKVDGEWTEAVEVPFNSDDYSTGHPAISPDGKKLYFVSDMPGTIGLTDIFVVDILGNNTFSEPKNLGPEINTERKEMFPFINNNKLYFSSDGHTGLGGLDIFEAEYSEEEGFQKATNLGKPFNSNKDDFSFIIDEEKQKGYFASNRIDGKGDDDIYSFERLEPEKVTINAIAGVVTELATGDVMPQQLVELLDENGIKLKEMLSEEDGSFIFEDLEANKKYTIKANREQYFENIQEVSTADRDTTNVIVAMKRLKEMIAIEDGIKKLKTEMIHFDFDKSKIRPDAAAELDKLIEVMIEYPKMVIKIESHTDSRGNNAYNKYLSDKRAKSTRNYIISKGISADRIQSAIGYGEERLLNNCDGSINCTENEHYLNRRSEFIVVSM